MMMSKKERIDAVIEELKEILGDYLPWDMFNNRVIVEQIEKVLEEFRKDTIEDIESIIDDALSNKEEAIGDIRENME